MRVIPIIVVRGTNRTYLDSRREARQAGQSVGVLSHPMPSSHYYCIPSHHISRRRHAREGRSRFSSLPAPSLPIPFRHIGSCSAACSALPCPCVPEFPLSFANCTGTIRTSSSPRISVMEPRRQKVCPAVRPCCTSSKLDAILGIWSAAAPLCTHGRQVSPPPSL
jgi:hypothetical protein